MTNTELSRGLERVAREAAEAWRVPCSTDPNDTELCRPKDDCVWGFEQGYLAALTPGEVERVAELQLAAFLAGRGSVTSMRHGTRTAKPAPTMDEFRDKARRALGDRIRREALEEIRRIVEHDDEANTKHGGLADCTDNDGEPYQSQSLANCLARARSLSEEGGRDQR